MRGPEQINTKQFNKLLMRSPEQINASTKNKSTNQNRTKHTPMYTYSFEKLNVWQQSRLLTKEIYLVTKNFPSEEKFGLTAQMRRAVISMSSNIAEGSSRKTVKDQAHFYTIAFSSLVELLNQLILSLDLGFLNDEKYIELRSSIELISNQLNKLRNASRSKNC